MHKQANGHWALGIGHWACDIILTVVIFTKYTYINIVVNQHAVQKMRKREEPAASFTD